MNTKQTRDPQKLDPLPFVRSMMRWDKNSDEFKAFKEDIKAHGIKHPVQITEDGKVVDGWTRVLAARDWQMTEVPVEVVSAAEVMTIFFRELCQRRNVTSSQRAYFVTRYSREYLLETARNHANSPEKGLVTGLPDEDSSRSLAKAGQTNYVYVQYAERIHKIFAKHADLKAEWEPKILAYEKPLGLGQALAGLGMFVVTTPGPEFNKRLNRDQHGGGKAKEIERQLNLFCETFTDDATARWDYYQKFDTQHRKKVFETIAEAAGAELPDTCKEKAKFYEELAEIYSTAAKGASRTGKEA